MCFAASDNFLLFLFRSICTTCKNEIIRSTIFRHNLVRSLLIFGRTRAFLDKPLNHDHNKIGRATISVLF